VTRKPARRRRSAQRDREPFLPTLFFMLCGAAFIGAVGFAFLRFDGERRPEVTDVQLARSDEFICAQLRVVDGDTIRCGEEQVRLAGIDAPEMPGHCRTGRDCTPGDPFRSKAILESLALDGDIRCTRQGIDSFKRILASCSNARVNLSCELVAQGAAVVRYGGYPC
jgi:micrococcal nuclease